MEGVLPLPASDAGAFRPPQVDQEKMGVGSS